MKNATVQLQIEVSFSSCKLTREKDRRNEEEKNAHRAEENQKYC